MIGLSRASFVLYQNQEEKQRKILKFPCGQPVFIRFRESFQAVFFQDLNFRNKSHHFSLKIREFP